MTPDLPGTTMTTIYHISDLHFGRALVAAQAATTRSDRLVAGYPNSFNSIELDRNLIRIRIRCWSEDGGVRDGERLDYRRSPAGWEPVSA